MRGSIWTVVALGSGLALVPAIINVDSPDATGQAVLDVVGSLAPVLGLLLFVTGMAVVISLVTSDGF
jgi:biopolymer transport protein ExbB/TolQ